MSKPFGKCPPDKFRGISFRMDSQHHLGHYLADGIIGYEVGERSGSASPDAESTDVSEHSISEGYPVGPVVLV